MTAFGKLSAPFVTSQGERFPQVLRKVSTVEQANKKGDWRDRSMKFSSAAYQKMLETVVLQPSRLVLIQEHFSKVLVLSQTSVSVLDWKDWRFLMEARGDSGG